MGDDIQAIKAGLMEVADLFVVNKSDRDGADRVVQESSRCSRLGEHGAWIPPVVKTVATTGAGLDELEAKFESTGHFLLVRRERSGVRADTHSHRGAGKKTFLEG